MKYQMYKSFRVLLALVVTLGPLSYPAVSYAKEFLSIGDSITQGLQRRRNGSEYGITSPVNGAANIGGYQPRLKSKLDAGIEPSNVYNWGFGGDLSGGSNGFSPGGVARIGSVLNSRPADFILIMYGANDLYAGISSNATRANMGNMIDQSLAKNVVPIVSEITPNIAANRVFYDKIATQYNPALKSIAAEKGVEIVLMFYEMYADWENLYNSGDGLHVSNTGYEKMSQVWFDGIQKVTGNSNSVPSIDLLLLSQVH